MRSPSGPLARRGSAHRGTPPQVSAPELYAVMVRMRLVEQALGQAWADGQVPGEYHSGIGEEGIVAGVLARLDADDTLALDHRGTPGFVGRGTDLRGLILEVLGAETGMNGGWAGHMHLSDPQAGCVADGIVGSSAALAVGQATAHQQLRPGVVAVAFHGEGASNAGVLLEAYNLAVAWRLPVLFVCKDNRWSITTRSRDVTGGDLDARARAFGLAVETVRGDDVAAVSAAADRLLRRARAGRGPGYLHATCYRPEGHFEGDPLLRLVRHPAREAGLLAPGLATGATAAGGATTRHRVAGLAQLGIRVSSALRTWGIPRRRDPVARLRRQLDDEVAGAIERREADRVRRVVEPALAEADRLAAAAAGPSFLRTRRAGS